MRHMVKDVVFTNDQTTKSLEALFGYGILGISIYMKFEANRCNSWTVRFFV